MNNEWAFLPMVPANDLLGDHEALQAHLAEHSYLYFQQVLDRDKILGLRRAILRRLRDVGWVPQDSVLIRGRVDIEPVREGDDEYFVAYDAIQRLEEFHTLAHDETLMGIMRDVLGPSAFPHPLKIARLGLPNNFEVSTPPHQDFPNNQGTPNLTASWIPVGDIPTSMGGLAVLRGSHHYGVLPLTTHFGAGNRCAILPDEMLERCRWVTTDYRAGDVLLFPSLTVHASLHNSSPHYLRLSVDFRYQLEGEALTEGCLEPHFGRLSWEDIYSGWKRTDHQYYWHDRSYEVVPFEELPLTATSDAKDEVARFMAYERRIGRAADAPTDQDPVATLP